MQAQYRYRDEVCDAADRAEPRVRTPVLSGCDVNQECKDDRCDDDASGDRGGYNVDLTEALVAAVAAQAADRFASSTEQDQGTERDHEAEREEPGAGVATDPHRSQHGNAESDGEDGQEPPGVTDLHRKSPRPGRRKATERERKRH